MTLTNWPAVLQGPMPSIHNDPATGQARVDPATGQPYNILHRTVTQVYGAAKPAKASLSDRIIARFLGDPASSKALDKAGLLAQIAEQYQTSTNPTTGVTKYSNPSGGFGYGGHSRAPIWWKNTSDPFTSGSGQIVVQDGLPGNVSQTYFIAHGATQPPIPSYAFPAISPAPQIHGAAGSDQTMCVYDPDTDILEEFEKMQKALHFPLTPSDPTKQITIASGGQFTPNVYVWKVTACCHQYGNPTVLGESDAKPKNQFDLNTAGYQIKANEQVTLHWYAFPAWGTQVEKWRIYRGAGGTANDNCFLIAELDANDPRLINDGNTISFTDDGSLQPATGAPKAPVGQPNTAWTQEWRCNISAIHHEASKSPGHYVPRGTDSNGRTIEDYWWGVTAPKIPVPTGLLLESEVRAFLLDPDNYVIPHALSIGAPNIGSSLIRQGAWAYPAQSGDGHYTGGTDGLLEGARMILNPDFDPADMDDLCAALPDVNQSTPGGTQIALTCDKWTKCIVRTLQRYGFFVHDGSGGFSIYAESTDIGNARDPADPYFVSNYMDLVVPNTAPGITGTSQAVISSKKQIRRNQQLSAVPWAQCYVPPVVICAGSSQCQFGGQVTTDRHFDLGAAVMGADFNAPVGTQLDDIAVAYNTGWHRNTHVTVQGTIDLVGGRAKAFSIPATYYMTGPVTGSLGLDYEIKTEVTVFDDYLDVLVGGAFVFEHCHRMLTDRRHYIGFGYNSANHAFVIRAFQQLDANQPQVPVVLAQLDYDLFATDPLSPVNSVAQSVLVGNYAAFYWNGVQLLETEIPAGLYDDPASKPGINIAFPESDLDQIQFDALWVYDRTPPVAPGQVRRIVHATIGGVTKTVDLLGGV